MHILRLVYKAFRLIGFVILGYMLLFVLSKLFPFIYNLMVRIQENIYYLAGNFSSFISDLF